MWRGICRNLRCRCCTFRRCRIDRFHSSPDMGRSRRDTTCNPRRYHRSYRRTSPDKVRSRERTKCTSRYPHIFRRRSPEGRPHSRHCRSCSFHRRHIFHRRRFGHKDRNRRRRRCKFRHHHTCYRRRCPTGRLHRDTCRCSKSCQQRKRGRIRIRKLRLRIRRPSANTTCRNSHSFLGHWPDRGRGQSNRFHPWDNWPRRDCRSRRRCQLRIAPERCSSFRRSFRELLCSGRRRRRGRLRTKRWRTDRKN